MGGVFDDHPLPPPALYPRQGGSSKTNDFSHILEKRSIDIWRFSLNSSLVLMLTYSAYMFSYKGFIFVFQISKKKRNVFVL